MRGCRFVFRQQETGRRFEEITRFMSDNGSTLTLKFLHG